MRRDRARHVSSPGDAAGHRWTALLACIVIVLGAVMPMPHSPMAHAATDQVYDAATTDLGQESEPGHADHLPDCSVHAGCSMQATLPVPLGIRIALHDQWEPVKSQPAAIAAPSPPAPPPKSL